MKQLDRTIQLVLREEIDPLAVPSKGLRERILHVGPGHTVFEVAESDRDELLEMLQNYPENRYYFRMSFVEDLSERSQSARCYLTHDGKFFKPKVNGSILYFLGLNPTIVEVERLERSRGFAMDSYRCTITSYSTCPSTGEVMETVLWDKTKFGRIENYLPERLKGFSGAVFQSRRRVTPAEA